MFNGKKIESLEQSINTLTERLDRDNNMIDALFDNIKELVEKLNDAQSENDKLKDELKEIKEKYIELAERHDAFKTAFENSYVPRIDRTFKEMDEKSDEDKFALKEEIKNVVYIISALDEKSNNADKEHSEQIKVLCDNNEKLIKKCEELQLSNVQIMNQHNDMIKYYEKNIKEYQTQTQAMKNNILKKMNVNNIISVVEE